MKYTVLGFQQKKLIRHSLSLDDAFLLNVIKHFYSSAGMESIIEDGQRYIWLKFSKLADEVPIVGSERSIKRKFEQLESKVFIKRILKHKKDEKSGTFLYMRLTKLVDDLSDYEEADKSSKMGGDKNGIPGVPKLSWGGYQNCHTKDPFTTDPSNIYPKQHGKSQKEIFKNIVDVVLLNKNITEDNNLYKPIKSIIDNFTRITGKEPVENDVITAYEILKIFEGSKYTIEKREELIIDIMQELQNEYPDKKINSVNYFKKAIINKFNGVATLKANKAKINTDYDSEVVVNGMDRCMTLAKISTN